MEGLDKKEEPNTRESKPMTGELLIKMNSYYDTTLRNVVPKSIALEAIRLSKIEALEEAVENLEVFQSIVSRLEKGVVGGCIATLNSQINELKNGK